MAVAFLTFVHGAIDLPAGADDHAVAEKGIAVLLAHPVGADHIERVFVGAGEHVGAPFVGVGVFPVGADANDLGARITRVFYEHRQCVVNRFFAEHDRPPGGHHHFVMLIVYRSDPPGPAGVVRFVDAGFDAQAAG